MDNKTVQMCVHISRVEVGAGSKRNLYIREFYVVYIN